ncbi:hypothetical protein THAOC_00938 [Thalassiosira oceanica]|uniref:Uncharacterized protein n=1 Tax=Thalassiosira oceanica TaxID=159749 RepID=K0TNL6_THAOC|nr:hypothetical protein THAOC_00938 [Thalassiosira oceanica]|eukprot:EJK77241.1 hypothetical protein THAOC_00938 [Thalassiosira oceanica]
MKEGRGESGKVGRGSRRQTAHHRYGSRCTPGGRSRSRMTASSITFNIGGVDFVLRASTDAALEIEKLHPGGATIHLHNFSGILQVRNDDVGSRNNEIPGEWKKVITSPRYRKRLASRDLDAAESELPHRSVKQSRYTWISSREDGVEMGTEAVANKEETPKENDYDGMVINPRDKSVRFSATDHHINRNDEVDDTSTSDPVVEPHQDEGAGDVDRHDLHLAPPAKAQTSPLKITSTAVKASLKMIKQIGRAGVDAYESLPDFTTSSLKVSQQSSSLVNQTQRPDDDVESAKIKVYVGTQIHHACASDDITYLQYLLENQSVLPDLAKEDSDGQLPINVFCNNEDLIDSDPAGCETVALTLVDLMNPSQALLAVNCNGLSPFVDILGRWTEKIHLAAGHGSEKQGASSESTSLKRRPAYFPLFGGQTKKNDRRAFSSFIQDRERLMYLPSSVEIPEHARWAVKMLSILIDRYPEQARELILTNVANVPLLMKSVLLIQDPDQLSELFDSTLVKHITMDKRTVNVWLCSMFVCGDAEIKMRAVAFIKQVSNMTLKDLAGSSHSPDRFSEDEKTRFLTLQSDAFNQVYYIQGIIPAILELGEDILERLATTRLAVYLTGVTLLSLYLTSRKLAKRHCMSISNMINVAAVAMLLSYGDLYDEYIGDAESDQDYTGFAASLTIILLWLKLMGHFKVLNAPFSLFLYTVNEVTKAATWFLAFMGAVLVMFADAARTTAVATGECVNQNSISGQDTTAYNFCSDSLFRVPAVMFAVLADKAPHFRYLSKEYFESSQVAIVIDSYERSKIRSMEIFGRNRIEYAAQLVARWSDFHVRSYVPHNVRRFLRFTYMIVSTVTFLLAEYGYFGLFSYLSIDQSYNAGVIRSLVIVYVAIGSLFNVYILMVVVVAWHAKRNEKMRADESKTALTIGFLDRGVKVFHRVLGVNADRTLLAANDEKQAELDV